jgi:predicted amidohydrolase
MPPQSSTTSGSTSQSGRSAYRRQAFWEHVLLSRAFENRYFVVSVNNAAAPQTLPSYVVAPSGEMLLAAEPRLEQALSCELDLSQVQPAWS